MKQNHQRIESPRAAVDGMFCRKKIMIGKIPPNKKCRNRVMIYATVSPVKRKDVTYVNGTMQIG